MAAKQSVYVSLWTGFDVGHGIYDLQYLWRKWVMKKLASISFIILLISVTIIASYALGEASVQSSDVFRSASLSAASTGTVTFSATIKNKGDVSVTTCSLEETVPNSV